MPATPEIPVMTTHELIMAARHAVKTGNWLIRRSDNGTAYRGFRWRPAGIWTEAPDWNPEPECGNGLHGQTRQVSGGNYGSGTRLEFCETRGQRVHLDNKSKVRYARILLINDLSPLAGLTFNGSLDLAGTAITSLPDNLKVGGSLWLRGTKITSLPDNLKVGGDLDLRDTKITSLPDNLKVGGSLYLRGTKITSLPDNLKVGGSLNLRDTAITEIPESTEIKGNIYGLRK